MAPDLKNLLRITDIADTEVICETIQLAIY